MKMILITGLLFVSMLSCKEKVSVKQDSVKTNKTGTPKKESSIGKGESANAPAWETVNDKLYNKYHSRIEFSDVEKVYKLLLSEKLISKNDSIDVVYYPTFTHLSPTVMLEDVLVGARNSSQPNEMQVLTPIDRDFILAQQELRSTRDFTWSAFTNKIAEPYTFPKIEIGIPVFSLDKNKFIVAVHKYKSPDCVTLISYMFITTGNKIKHYVFETVTDCK